MSFYNNNKRYASKIDKYVVRAIMCSLIPMFLQTVIGLNALHFYE
ncbi:21573_t:CDS:1, partial [Gigaspora margarita]